MNIYIYMMNKFKIVYIKHRKVMPRTSKGHVWASYVPRII